MNTATLVWRVKSYLSPRRWRRLGLSAVPMLAEVAGSYRVYRRAADLSLPDMVRRMGEAGPAPDADVGEMVRVTDWFLHPMYGGGRCMPRACILFRMLVRRGYEPTIIFGVAKGETPDSELDGHAWLVLEGEPLAENEDPRLKFVETYRYAVTLHPAP